MSRNEGIIVSGSGRLDAGVLAVGRGAHAEGSGSVRPERAEIDEHLVALVAELSRRRDELPDGPQLAETAESVRQELAKDEPNGISITGLLSGLAAGVSKVAGLATSVATIQGLVAGVL